MSRYLLFFLFFTAPVCMHAQQQVTDTLHSKNHFSSRRFGLVTGGMSTIWLGGSVGLWTVWYDDHKTEKFHFFNDASDWLMTDKLGHLYTAYHLSNYSYKAMHWSGMKNKTAIWLGSAIGLGFQTTLEIMDGYSSGWGFSWADVASNSIGTTLFCAQELLWNEQRILPKFSYHPTGYATVRPEILGHTQMERLIKDYNGQTYWFSFSPGRFLNQSAFPKWLCFSIGYSPDAKLVGDQQSFTDYSVNNSYTYYAKQQWLLSLDVDFTALPIKRKWVKSLVEPLNLLKIPFPALIISNGKVNGNWMYF